MHIPVLQIPCTGQLLFHFTDKAAYQQFIARKHTHCAGQVNSCKPSALRRPPWPLVWLAAGA